MFELTSAYFYAINRVLKLIRYQKAYGRSQAKKF